MTGAFNALHNHPSILYYTIFNEGWGQYCADEMYLKAKRLDRTRIVDTTSGWFKRSLSDVDSNHVYFKHLPARNDSAYPFVISEFGGYSHRVEGHLFGDKNYGYKKFETAAELEDSIASLYENEVLPLVKQGASAFIYTQLSDVEDETNGFITYDRRVLKVDKSRMLAISKNLYDAAEELTRAYESERKSKKKQEYHIPKFISVKRGQGTKNKKEDDNK